MSSGFLVGWFLRRTSLRWLPAGVAFVAVAAVVAGVFGTARAMFLSSHDFHVVLVVLLVAGVVALVFSMLVGSTVVRWSRSLREDARRFGESGEFVSQGRGPPSSSSCPRSSPAPAIASPSPVNGRRRSKTPAASWSPGSRTTCGPRSRDCVR